MARVVDALLGEYEQELERRARSVTLQKLSRDRPNRFGTGGERERRSRRTVLRFRRTARVVDALLGEYERELERRARCVALQKSSRNRSNRIGRGGARDVVAAYCFEIPSDRESG